MFIHILCSFVYMIDLYVGICMLHVSKVVTKNNNLYKFPVIVIFVSSIITHVCQVSEPSCSSIILIDQLLP